MSLFTSFKKVIASFGMEKITKPVFYNSEIAIRFNIGDNGNEAYIRRKFRKSVVNPKYVDACLERALKIYNKLKTAPDLLMIEGYLGKGESTEKFISSVTSAVGMPEPDEINSEIIHDDDDEFTHLFLFWDLKDFCPDRLLKEIILADLDGVNSFLVSSVYFVSTRDNVLFYLYDDRGADLVADEKEKISHIYDELNDLVLDYDRERIDAIFRA